MQAPPPPTLPDWCLGTYIFHSVKSTTLIFYIFQRKKMITTRSNEIRSQFQIPPHRGNTYFLIPLRFKNLKLFSDATRLPPRKRMRKTNAVFMEGVPGIEVFTKEPDVYELQRKVQAMCKWAG